ncbi:esterase/lipase family protein [Lachnotalea glycerini]|nr:lipase [Lachnotalea glycerini]
MMTKIMKRSAIFNFFLLFTVFASSVKVLPANAAERTVDAGTDTFDDANADTLNAASATNHYPIIMVHGLFGWGNDELFDINYWGGKNSLREFLTNNGYTVYTPTIGSISSNWDRACELYAYLVGGTVDYGQVHSQAMGHARFGKTYPGVYRDLGTADENGNLKKVHLMGHSMGGETIRVLAQLLENGDSDEIEQNTSDISPLFCGGHHWIESITTIATPHDGSQYDEIQAAFEPFIHKFFASISAKGGVLDSNNPCIDLKMDQWGLKKKSDETYTEYIDRVFDSNIWKNTKDLSIWDLSLEGAKELNSWVKAQSDIYYFSVACVDTHAKIFTGYHTPNLNMNSLLIKSSIIMGNYTNHSEGKVLVDSSWWPNDGIVSVRSAIGPHEGSADEIIDYNPDSPVRGVWNYMGELDDVDHLEIVEQESSHQKELQNKFLEWAQILSQLPD